jgi:hydrogenase/urease accessory protein HupE
MRLPRPLLSASLLALLPALADAHSAFEGLGSFYNGLLHPIFVPAHLLLIIAIGLFSGLQGLKRFEPLFGAYIASTIIGLAVAWFVGELGIEIFILILAGTLGGLIALKPELQLYWCSGLVILAGLFLGLDSAQELLAGTDKFVSMLGSGLTVYLLTMFVIPVAQLASQREWSTIGLRVLGSWIAASSLLVLAFTVSAVLS